MAKISASEKKRIIAQIKRRNLSPTDLARRGLLKRMSVSAPRRPDLRAIKEVLRAFDNAGFDIKKLNELVKRDQRGRDRQLKEIIAASKKSFAAVQDPFRYGIKERIKTLKRLSTLARPGQADHVILDTPILIWAHPPGILDEATIQPSKSFARCHFQTDAPTEFEKFQTEFWFWWQNNYGQEVMINAESVVTRKGICMSWANLTDLHSWCFATIQCDIGLDIFEQWNHPETSPLQEQSQVVSFSDTFFSSSSVLGYPSSDSELEHIFQTVNPAHGGFFIVPRNESVLFLVFVLFSNVVFLHSLWGDNFCADTVDFSKSDLNTTPGFIQCPFVHLEVIVPPIVT